MINVRRTGGVVLLLLAGRVYAQQTPSAVAPSDGQAAIPAQQAGADGFSLKVMTQNVVLDVVVKDKSGKNIRGLSKDAFVVFEDKTPQEIASFEETLPEKTTAAIRSTAELDRLEPDAPVSILVIDEVTTEFQDLAFARYSLKKYLKAQGDVLAQPTLLLAVNYKNIAVLRDYTTSRKEILDALARHFADYSQVVRARDPAWAGDQINAAFGSLIGVAEATAGHRGHKNMIWIGRGLPTLNTGTTMPDMLTAFENEVALCSRLLRDSRVTMYAVDPAGISVYPPMKQAQSLGPNAAAGAVDVDESLGGQEDFDSMARATGGQALHGRNDVDAMIDESVTDGESFYTISYRPAAITDSPKAFRKIRVVLRNPELRATTREGYFTKAAAVAPVKEGGGKYSERLIVDMNVAVGSQLVYDGLPFTVLRDPTVPDRFQLRIRAEDLPLALDGAQKFNAELTVVAASFDKRGKMIRHTSQLTKVELPPMKAGDGSQSGPDHRLVGVPVTIFSSAPAARVRFVVRANGNGKVGAENYSLVDPKTTTDSASEGSR